jgi:RNA polymerase sigma-70 factor, ECF subfamily
VLFFKRSLKNLSDEDLMEQASEGSELALETIYHRHSQPLLRYFYRMLWQDKTKSEDFLHDLFIKIVENKSAFDADRKFSTWIYSIAHNMCKNEYRKQAFRKEASILALTPDITNESITAQLDHQSFQFRLSEILSEEDEEVRTMFALRYELEMDVAQIAEIIQCPEGTIKSRLFYLKKRLATQLQHYKMILEK